MIQHLRTKTRDLRLRKGWTQHQLAARTGCDPVTVSRWETGRIILRADTLAMIAVALGAELVIVEAGTGVSRAEFDALVARLDAVERRRGTGRPAVAPRDTADAPNRRG